MLSSEGSLSHTTVAYVYLTTCNQNQRLRITVTVKFVEFRGNWSNVAVCTVKDTMNSDKWLWTFGWNILSPFVGVVRSKFQFPPNYTVSVQQTAVWVLNRLLGIFAVVTYRSPKTGLCMRLEWRRRGVYIELYMAKRKPNISWKAEKQIGE